MHVLLYLTKANSSKFHCKLGQAPRLENAIIPAFINFCKYEFLPTDLFWEFEPKFMSQKSDFLKKIAKVYKNYASKKSKYSQGSGSNPLPLQRDMIFPLFKARSFFEILLIPQQYHL